jgi:GNAT superfamily N-acetyltransferase
MPYGGAVEIRPMTGDDVPAAEELSDEAFYQADLACLPRNAPAPQRRSAKRSRTWIDRTLRLLDTDAAGCWVAADDSGLLGFATSAARERLWILSTFTVRPGMQGRGIGRGLLARAQQHGAGCDRALLGSSDDQQALRRYHVAGFTLYPQMLFEGEVDRSALPATRGLREGTADDQGWMDDLDRELRGGPHGPDHAALADSGRLVVSSSRDGYAYCAPSRLLLLAARDERTATRLAWECLAGIAGQATIPHVTSFNMWAADVALRARLALRHEGFLGVRAMEPPAPYIHNGPLL